MTLIELYLDIQDNKPVKYKMDLAISEIKINTSGIVLSLVVPAKVELTTGTHIVILYGMFGSKSGYMLRCRLDEVHPEYLRCSF